LALVPVPPKVTERGRRCGRIEVCCLSRSPAELLARRSRV
jgi:hypothetical protein